MIRIDVNKASRSPEIIKIYRKLSDKVVESFKKYSANNNCKDIVDKFNEIFGNGENIQRKNVFQYLLNADSTEMLRVIKEFNVIETKGKTYPQKLLSGFNQLGANTRICNIKKKLKEPKSKEEIEFYNDFVEDLEEFFHDNPKDTLNKKNKEEFLEDKPRYRTYILDLTVELEKIINYNMLDDADRHAIISALNITVCPYCNRQFISSWKDKTQLKTTGDLDHFFCKSKYPIVSLCLHNFIPSCQICNSRFKLQKDFLKEKHIYPYEQEFGDDAKFIIENIDALMGEKAKFKISNESKDLKNEIDNSIKTFHINEIYEIHENIVENIISRAQIYNDVYLESIENDYKGLFSSKDELRALIFNNQSLNEDLPLVKLKRDIMDDLGIDI